MTSLTDARPAELTSQNSRYAWLRAHVGTLAVAIAIVFAASVWGYVNSAAFAVFFTLFVGFLIALAFSYGFLSSGGGPNALLGLGCFFLSVFLLYLAIVGSLAQIRPAESASVAAARPAAP